MKIGSVCRVQKPDAPDYEEQPNPVGMEDLSRYCSSLVPATQLSRPVISVTGGEPLLQYEFLAGWLPRVRPVFQIYLETSGIHHNAMKIIRGLVDVVSMDFKLPSATGQGPFWREHERFLSAVAGRNVFVKIVVTETTSTEDIMTAASLIAGSRPDTVLVVQPASGQAAPSAARLVEFQNKALGIIRDVRIIPQIHKILGLP